MHFQSDYEKGDFNFIAQTWANTGKGVCVGAGADCSREFLESNSGRGQLADVQIKVVGEAGELHLVVTG
jgi:hypothetical protein